MFPFINKKFLLLCSLIDIACRQQKKGQNFVNFEKLTRPQAGLNYSHIVGLLRVSIYLDLYSKFGMFVQTLIVGNIEPAASSQ